MKIIKKGTIPTPKEPWWVNTLITCSNCSTVIELEPSDKDKVDDSIDRSPDGRRSVNVRCPICAQSIHQSWPNRK